MEGNMQEGSNLLLQLMKGRWVMVVASFYILFCSGATFIFGIYSGAIKKAMGYDQSTIDTLGFFKDLGATVGIISGLMYEVAPPWLVLAMGGLMNLLGYLLIWLAVTHRIPPPPKWQMYLFLCVGANSQSFPNTGALVTLVKNFPHGRGEVLGIVKGCVGLSGAIFAQFYLAIYGEDTTGIILLIAWLPSLVTLIFMPFIRIMKPAHDKYETRNFYSFLYVALALAAFLMLAIILENELHLPAMAYRAFAAVVLIFLISNMAIGIRAQLAFRSQELSAKAKQQAEVKVEEGKASSEDGKPPELQQNLSLPRANPCPNPPEDENLVTNQRSTPLKHACCSLMVDARLMDLSKKPNFTTKLFKNWPERGEDFTIPQAIVSMDMLILFITTTCGLGATVTAIDNMGQIGESQGYDSKTITTFVSLISIWSFLGRVMAGFISEILLRRYRFPRTLVLTIVLALACVGNILIAFPASNTLYIASVMVGLCFGAQWPVLFAIISELFGLKYYATLHTIAGLAGPLGSYLCNVRVAGYLYDREALRQHNAALLLGAMSAPGDHKCMGSACFRITFSIMTVISAFGSLVSSLLVLRTKAFYGKDIYSKFNVDRSSEEN